MEKKDLLTQSVSAAEISRKNKPYSRLRISIGEYKTVDVICTSDQSYDTENKEWYDNDGHWGL